MTTDIKDVTPWGYCPECGEVKIHHQEGNHKQCAACYQEWFSDLDYSETVHSNLSALFLAKRSSALALEALAGEVERLTMEAKTATTLLEAEKWSRAHVKSIIVSDLEAERDRLKAALEGVCAIAYDHGSIAAIAHARKALGDAS